MTQDEHGEKYRFSRIQSCDSLPGFFVAKEEEWKLTKDLHLWIINDLINSVIRVKLGLAIQFVMEICALQDLLRTDELEVRRASL